MHKVDQKADEPADRSRPRKPYIKPEVSAEPIFETAALACGKIPQDSGWVPRACIRVKKLS